MQSSFVHCSCVCAADVNRNKPEQSYSFMCFRNSEVISAAAHRVFLGLVPRRRRPVQPSKAGAAEETPPSGGFLLTAQSGKLKCRDVATCKLQALFLQQHGLMKTTWRSEPCLCKSYEAMHKELFKFSSPMQRSICQSVNPLQNFPEWPFHDAEWNGQEQS